MKPSRWATAVLAAVHAVAALVGCGSPRATPSDAGPGELLGAAGPPAAWSTPGGPVFRRSDALAAAHALEASAAREGAGARAASLHYDAAVLLERAFRLYAKDQDGKEAAEIFLAASRDRSLATSCDLALRGARLLGEAARDPSVTYKELHRAEVRLRGIADGGAPAPNAAACTLALAEAKNALEAWKPAPAVLAAVEHGVIGEGDLPTTATSAVRVSAPHVVRVDAWPGQDATRVVIELDRAATFRIGDEAGPGGRGARTFVDLDGVETPGAQRETPLAGVVSKVTAGGTSTGTRVLLELDGQGYRRVFHLLEPYRVVVDVARKPPESRGRRAVSRVLLDPGHGGADPGAIGPSGLREADVTVDIVRRTAKALAADGLTVVVTRDGDKTVSLEERAALANSAGADLFVSVHCNAAENRAKHGVETYVLDTASDVVANRVAARENATSVAASSEIGGILASLRLSDQSKSSVRLAELVQRGALASIRPTVPDAHDGGVHRAGFYVLVGARMPSVLFETSYISNADEEARLRDEAYRQRLAEGVANAIRAYREGR